MENKINRKLLLGEKGFSWHPRYSFDENSDECGRWARVCYYNGLYIGWINGFVVDENKKIDFENRLIGKCNIFSASLDFPTTSNQGGVGGKSFDSVEDAKKYVEEMFIDFKKIINSENDIKYTKEDIVILIKKFNIELAAEVDNWSRDKFIKENLI